MQPNILFHALLSLQLSTIFLPGSILKSFNYPIGYQYLQPRRLSRLSLRVLRTAEHGPNSVDQLSDGENLSGRRAQPTRSVMVSASTLTERWCIIGRDSPSTSYSPMRAIFLLRSRNNGIRMAVLMQLWQSPWSRRILQKRRSSALFRRRSGR